MSGQTLPLLFKDSLFFLSSFETPEGRDSSGITAPKGNWVGGTWTYELASDPYVHSCCDAEHDAQGVLPLHLGEAGQLRLHVLLGM